MEELVPLLLEKIRQCMVLFDFRTPHSDLESKKIKQIDLEDILDYVVREENQIPTSIYCDLIAMVRISNRCKSYNPNAYISSIGKNVTVQK